MKELAASVEDSSLIKQPTLYTKIDMQTLNKFDFDGVQHTKFKKKEMKARRE